MEWVFSIGREVMSNLSLIKTCLGRFEFQIIIHNDRLAGPHGKNKRSDDIFFMAFESKLFVYYFYRNTY